MKIAIMGSAPSSLRLAPFGDPSWKIWGCSPGLFPNVPRVDAWFELHRWEPPVIGNPALQKPWFSPEYVLWMAKQKLVWMKDKVPEIPNSHPYPESEIRHLFGDYFFTSSIAWMLAMAIDQIITAREAREARNLLPMDGTMSADIEPDAIALYGVDMAADEEYGYQRAGCQHFVSLAHLLDIQIIVPPESDLLRPMPGYGLAESDQWHIKLLSRHNELTARLAQCDQQLAQMTQQRHFLAGAISDNDYHMKTWGQDREGRGTNPGILAASPRIRALVNKTALEPSAVVVPTKDEFTAASAKLDAMPIPTKGRQAYKDGIIYGGGRGGGKTAKQRAIQKASQRK